MAVARTHAGYVLDPHSWDVTLDNITSNLMAAEVFVPNSDPYQDVCEKAAHLNNLMTTAIMCAECRRVFASKCTLLPAKSEVDKHLLPVNQLWTVDWLENC